MSMTNLPTIEHATVTLNNNGRVVIRMDEGWAFYDLGMYPEGTPAEDICYYGYGVYSATYNFANIIVVDETTVHPDQIYSVGNETVTE